MNAHVPPPANVDRFPPRLRVVSDNRRLSDPRPTSALDALLSAGTIDERQHAAGLAYARLRRRFDASGGFRRSWKDDSGMSDETWQALKRDHAALIRAVGAERFVLDRLCLDGDAPLRCEVERVRAALGRARPLYRSRAWRDASSVLRLSSSRRWNPLWSRLD